MNAPSPYAPPKTEPLDSHPGKGPPKVGWLLGLGAALVGMLNLGASMELAEAQSTTEAEVSGFVLGVVVILPLLFVGLSQFTKSYRNMRTRVKIFFYTSFVLWLSSIVQLAEIRQAGS